MPFPARIVSLLPSATELVCAVGAGDRLVGRSHECDWPAGLVHTPVLTSSRIQGADPGEIDRAVREALGTAAAGPGFGDGGGASLYRLDEAMLAALRPDLILTQDLCEVCSIDLAAVRRVVARLGVGTPVLSLNPVTVDDVLDDVLRVGEAVGLDAEARALCVRLRERMFRAEEFVNPYADGPVVGFLEWTDPLFVAGHWTVQLIERAGGRHPWNPAVPNPGAGAAVGPQVAERRAAKSRRVSPEEFVAASPEFLIICPCGLGLDAVRDGAAVLASQPWWDALPAVRSGRVAIVDGNQMFNRPGPRLVEAFEWLVGWLNGVPEVCPADFPWEHWAG